jgi:hypothetical protein
MRRFFPVTVVALLVAGGCSSGIILNPTVDSSYTHTPCMHGPYPVVPPTPDEPVGADYHLVCDRSAPRPVATVIYLIDSPPVLSDEAAFHGSPADPGVFHGLPPDPGAFHGLPSQ